MVEFTSEKIHAEGDIVTVNAGILDCFLDFLRQFGSQRFIGIHQEDPVIGQRQRFHRPLALLGPTALVMELYDVRAVGLCDLCRRVRTLRVDDVDLAQIAERFEAARQIAGFVARGNDCSHREERRRAPVSHLLWLFQLLHREWKDCEHIT